LASGRLRLAAALLLLALPLAVAVWSFGSYAARRERDNADQRLTGALGAASGAYRNVLDEAQQRAQRIASSPRVQRAFLKGRASGLTRIQRTKFNVVLTRKPSGATLPPNAGTRTVEVLSGGRRIGRVIAFVPLDRRLAARLTRATNGHRLGVKHGGVLVRQNGPVRLQSRRPLTGAGDLLVGGTSYRVVATRLGQGGRAVELVALKRSSAIDADANSARWRVMGVGFGLIAALLTIAYAVAPAIARSRVSKQERDQAERVLAHVGDGIFLVDHEGVIRLWNAAAEAITGLRADAIRGRPARETIPGWAAITAIVPVAPKPGGANEALGAETVPLEIAGKEIWLSIVGVALADGTVYAFRDVTRERRLEDLRSEFVATISHELRTPLASLHGAALTLREHSKDLNPQTQHDLLDMIAAQSRRLADLIEEILVAGQLDSGSLHVVSEPFEPEELVWATAAAARVRVDERMQIDVSMATVLPMVTGDARRTRQVLSNLVDNAIKYSPDGGRIELIVDADDEHVRFSVRDEGLGIPLGEQQRIFDKFYRLDPDQRRGIGGSGLGLYICQELVRSMNGRIHVESDPGEGAVFTFELPVAERIATTSAA
jgi:two-component system, OmpR family, phosphate regulon sensor histidine kinase PhoR